MRSKLIKAVIMLWYVFCSLLYAYIIVAAGIVTLRWFSHTVSVHEIVGLSSVGLIFGIETFLEKLSNFTRMSDNIQVFGWRYVSSNIAFAVVIFIFCGLAMGASVLIQGMLN